MEAYWVLWASLAQTWVINYCSSAWGPSFSCHLPQKWQLWNRLSLNTGLPDTGSQQGEIRARTLLNTHFAFLCRNGSGGFLSSTSTAFCATPWMRWWVSFLAPPVSSLPGCFIVVHLHHLWAQHVRALTWASVLEPGIFEELVAMLEPILKT